MEKWDLKKIPTTLRDMCILGVSERKIASIYGVSRRVVRGWKIKLGLRHANIERRDVHSNRPNSS